MRKKQKEKIRKEGKGGYRRERKGKRKKKKELNGQGWFQNCSFIEGHDGMI